MNHSLSKWVDCIVRANDGDVGTVEQFYFDDLTWIIRYMVVNTGGRPPCRHVLISMAALGKPNWEKRVLPVNLTLAQVHSSPKTDIDQPVSRQHEVELHEHYAWPVYWGGGFYVTPGYGIPDVPVGDAETAAEMPSSGVRKVNPHLRGTRDVTGCVVHATDGNIGHVEDFLVDDEAWIIHYLVVNTRNWLPDRQVLVSPQWISRMSWTDKKIFVDLARDAVKKSPAFDPSKPVSPDYEGKLLAHLQKAEVTEWVLFKFHASPKAKVYVAGTFNNWDPTAIKLGDNSNGTYTAMVLLPPGRCEYKFIVNGAWHNGPEGREQVPNAFGTTNSVLVVGRTTDHNVHLHTFSRPPVSQGRLNWSTPMGG
jgi:hypothetical protein